jgi:hypothetical protein
MLPPLGYDGSLAARRVPHSLGTVSTESAARRYYKAIVEFESTLQGHEACDLTVSPYRVYPFPPLVYDGTLAGNLTTATAFGRSGGHRGNGWSTGC